MRVRGRVETVLDWANARGYRDSDNPARWKGHLANLLPKRDKLRAVKHHPAPALNAAATVSLPSHSSPVQLVERPRIESTRTSSSCSRAAASGYRAFQRSRPASASALRAAFPRNRWFADSAPEGSGFEPSVPPRKRGPRERPRGRPLSSRETTCTPDLKEAKALLDDLTPEFNSSIPTAARGAHAAIVIPGAGSVSDPVGFLAADAPIIRVIGARRCMCRG